VKTAAKPSTPITPAPSSDRVVPIARLDPSLRRPAGDFRTRRAHHPPEL